MHLTRMSYLLSVPTSRIRACPTASTWARGSIDVNGGRFVLTPVRWISQPQGYTMIGLEGVSNDRGSTFAGQIVGGAACTTFSVQLVYTSTALQAPRAPLLPRAQRFPEAGSQATGSRIEVPLQMQMGTFLVPVQINNALTLDFMIDSGASDVSIPADVVLTLMRTGTLRPTDFIGTQNYRLADGSIVPSATFRIRALKIGSREVPNVTGSVAPVNGALLLGQSFLSRFSSWSISNQQRTLILE